MRVIKPKLSISKLFIFGCTVFMRKRDREVSKLEPKALEGKFMDYTEGDNGYLVYVPNTRQGVRSDHQGVNAYRLWYPLRLISGKFAEANHIV